MSAEDSPVFDGRRWSNAAEDRVEIAAPDPDWPRQFEAEAQAIRRALAAIAAAAGAQLAHIGSTAVPGLPAKPVIDILMLLPDTAVWPLLPAPLGGLGYVWWAENPRRDRLFFVKGMPPYGSGRSHHLHVRVPEDGRDELRFRDLLRGDEQQRERYAALKRMLALQYPEDREAYTAGKAPFVQALLAAG